MKKNIILLIGLVLPVTAWTAAGDAGSIEIDALSQVLTGNIGLAIGLALTAWGVFKAFVKGETGGGLLLIVCGVLLTIFPGVFNSAVGLMKPITDSLSGN